MSASTYKALVDASFVIFLIFMTSSLSYAGNLFTDKTDLFYSGIFGFIAIIIAGLYKVIEGLIHFIGFFRIIAYSVFGFVIVPILIFCLSLISLILGCIDDCNVGHSQYCDIWFSTTFIATFASMPLMIFSFFYFRKPIKKNMLLQ